jgi:hypothetical protein
MVQGDRVTIVNGDLTGTATLSSLGSALSKLDETVSVIDISNAVDYFEKNEEVETRFLSKISALPIDKNTSILFTYPFRILSEISTVPDWVQSQNL